MKQVININYHGRIIPIETTAYELLKKYSESLHLHFKDEEGKEEIINDIESRISELFQEQLDRGVTCITDIEVNDVIKSMGTPEEFGSDVVSGQIRSEDKDDNRTNSSPRRLLRDENNKLLGGVCSGLANYLTIDLVLVRIIFIILFGVLFLPYLILWIAVPSSATMAIGSKRKKLYRDTDEKVIAGVCSGLAHYFGIQTWIPRLIFSLSFLTFTFRWYHLMNITPGFFVIYIIFWLVMPEAKTTSEKLEMKGEKVDLNTIQNSIKEEMKEVKERAEEMSKMAGNKAKELRKESAGLLRRAINTIVNSILILVKILSYTILIAIGIVVLITLFVFSVVSFVAFPFKDFLLNGFWQNGFAIGTLLFFVILAFVAVIVYVIKKIAGIKKRSKWMTATFISLWVLGWISLFGLAYTLGNDFSKLSHRPNNETEIPIVQPSGDRLVIRLNKAPFYYDENENLDFFEAMDVFRDSVFIQSVNIKVIRSLDDSFHIRLVRSAHGSTRFAADTTAAAIKFSVFQSDSILTIDQGIFINKKTKFRNQQLFVLVSVPEGKKISLPMDGSISNFNYDSWEFNSRHEEPVSNSEFWMTRDGLVPVTKGVTESPYRDSILDRLEGPINRKIDSLIDLRNKMRKRGHSKKLILKNI